MEIIRKTKSNFHSLEEILLFIQVFFCITIVPFLLKLLTIPGLMKILTPKRMKIYKTLNLEESKDKIIRFTGYILNRNFWIYKNTCLNRSLVLYHFLRKSGINAHICFGVKYNEELSDREVKKKIEGHAWLIYKGEIFLEKNVDETETYKMIYCFPERKEQVRQKEF